MEGLSVKERLKQAAEEIAQIQVPVGLADQISRPLCKNLCILWDCIDELEKEEPAEQEAESDV